jgi:hypothetical protein
MNNILYLPISIGEAIDKLTILDIKCEKIIDSRKVYVQNEYDILYEKLKDFIIIYNELYESMKKINLLIWHQMDIIRDLTVNDEEYNKLCRECVESNDIRFRIKNKINLISKSFLKEQKSYNINKKYIIINCNEKYFDLFIKPIKYYSYIYDEITIQTTKNVDNLKNIFSYDNTIKFTNILDSNQENILFFHDVHYDLNKILDMMDVSLSNLELI